MCKNCKEIIEIYAGMEGFVPETAPEAYQERIIKQMYDCAKKTNDELTITLEFETAEEKEQFKKIFRCCSIHA